MDIIKNIEYLPSSNGNRQLDVMGNRGREMNIGDQGKRKSERALRKPLLSQVCVYI